MSHKKCVWLIDDSEDPDNIKYTHKEWVKLLPDHNVVHFSSPVDVIDALIHGTKDELPQIMVFDANTEKVIYLGGVETTPSNYGGSKYFMLVALAMRSEGIPFPKNIIFSSADPRYATACKQYADSLSFLPSDRIVACDKWSITYAAHLQNKEDQFDEEYADFELYERLNDFTDAKLPTNEDALDQYRIKNRMIRLEDVARFFRDGKLSASQALSIFYNDAWIEPERKLYEYSNSWEHVQMHYTAERIDFQSGAGTAAQGHAVFSVEKITESLQQGNQPILITENFNPDWYPLLSKLSGIILVDGRDAAHTMFIAEAHKIPILVSAENPDTSLTKNSLSCGETTIEQGDPITLDGRMEKVFKGHLSIEPNQTHGYVPEILKIYKVAAKTDGFDWMKFKANIDFPRQISEAFCFNADGIGLVRTEHFAFIDPVQTKALRQIFLNGVSKEAIKAFSTNHKNQLLEMFSVIHEEMPYSGITDSYPVRVRLLDAPPEEFMTGAGIRNFDALIKKENQRGVQLGLRRPELYKAQIGAIFQAYAQSLTEVDKDHLPIKTNLEVMIPMVRSLEEFEAAKAMVEEGAEKFGFSPSNYRVGMMGETVRAMSDIKTFASKTPFVSIGSNDLSFEVLGLSRFGNTSKHISVVEDGARHPSVTLFREVSGFILDAIDKARMINPKIEIDLCGAHAADLSSLKKLQKANLSSVSLIPSGRNHHALKADWALYNWGLLKKGLCP